MRISDWSSDVCSSDLRQILQRLGGAVVAECRRQVEQRDIAEEGYEQQGHGARRQCGAAIGEQDGGEKGACQDNGERRPGLLGGGSARRKQPQPVPQAGGRGTASEPGKADTFPPRALSAA